MRRYKLSALALAFMICMPVLVQAEGGSGSKNPLEDIINIFLGTINKGQAPPATGKKVYAENELIKRYIASRFRIILNREPSDVELNRFTSRLERGSISEEELITALLVSDEYYNRRENNDSYLTTLFRAVLNREPRGHERDLYARLLDRGAMTRLQLREELFQKMEFEVIRLARKELPKYGAAAPALGAFSQELYRRAEDMAEQAARERRGGGYLVQDVKEKLHALADEGRKTQQTAESGKLDYAYLIDIRENLRYAIYSIDEAMDYGGELYYLSSAWKDTRKLALVLLAMIDFTAGEQGEIRTGQTGQPAAPAHSRRIELMVAENTGTRVDNPLDLNSNKAREIAKYILDNLEEYTRGKGLSLVEEFELERSLKLLISGRTASRKVAISDLGRDRYVVYFFMNL